MPQVQVFIERLPQKPTSSDASSQVQKLEEANGEMDNNKWYTMAYYVALWHLALALSLSSIDALLTLGPLSR